MKNINLLSTLLLSGGFSLAPSLLTQENLSSSIKNDELDSKVVNSISRTFNSSFRPKPGNATSYWNEDNLIQSIKDDANILLENNPGKRIVKIGYLDLYRNYNKVSNIDLLPFKTALLGNINIKNIWDIKLNGEQTYIFLTGYQFKYNLSYKDRNGDSSQIIFDSGKKWDKVPKLEFKYNLYV
ncbi:hypothetical protein [Spiroplasma alleghenense]|uniref:Uncharacterized protein n=1 Tax=Spiroplasma alleghenense TaxID=216931 RepID=A0A345Z585_9MOLU|nr:hypothetical protein [Spiroplasma alleghenense]AXK51764.1 hypothetical protein SALLE_v1c10940 [Spiroplasma alleghenense]